MDDLDDQTKGRRLIQSEESDEAGDSDEEEWNEVSHRSPILLITPGTDPLLVSPIAKWVFWRLHNDGDRSLESGAHISCLCFAT